MPDVFVIARSGDTDRMRQLLAEDADAVAQTDPHKWTALHYARRVRDDKFEPAWSYYSFRVTAVLAALLIKKSKLAFHHLSGSYE